MDIIFTINMNNFIKTKNYTGSDRNKDKNVSKLFSNVNIASWILVLAKTVIVTMFRNSSMKPIPTIAAQ